VAIPSLQQPAQHRPRPTLTPRCAPKLKASSAKRSATCRALVPISVWTRRCVAIQSSGGYLTLLRCLLQSQSVTNPTPQKNKPFGAGILSCGPDKLQTGSMSLLACRVLRPGLLSYIENGEVLVISPLLVQPFQSVACEFHAVGQWDVSDAVERHRRDVTANKIDKRPIPAPLHLSAHSPCPPTPPVRSMSAPVRGCRSVE
jgi:hypothetical protein